MVTNSSLMRVVPRSAFVDFNSLVVPPGTPATAVVELRIAFRSEMVVARDLAAYLEIIDRVFGRFESESLLQYSLKKDEHLRISKIQSGSVELLLKALASNGGEVTFLVVLGLFLKYLPEIFRSAAASFKDYQEGAMLREQRRQLHEKTKADRELSTLDDKRRRQLVALLDTLYGQEHRRLPAARRFAQKSVNEIKIGIAERRDDISGKSGV